MRGLTVHYVDGSNNIFNEEFTANFVDLLEWLINAETTAFKANGHDRVFILYKHAIRSVELY